MRDWRVPPRAGYAFAFLALAIMLSAVILGASMMAVPGAGAFDDDQVRLVAENRLSAVEATWVDEQYIQIESSDGSTIVNLDRVFPTRDPTVGWVVGSYLRIIAENKDLERRGWDRYWGHDAEALTGTVDDGFERFTTDGTYCAWELWFNGTRVHFGSDTVKGPDMMPETRWTVSHDHSGEAEWSPRGATVPFRASLVLHLWFETEEPSF